MKPIHKLNGGLGATLCHTCTVIISTGLTEDLYCNSCKNKQTIESIIPSGIIPSGIIHNDIINNDKKNL